MVDDFKEEYPPFDRDRHDLCTFRCGISSVKFQNPDAQELEREVNDRTSGWRALDKLSLDINTSIEDLEVVQKFKQYWNERPVHVAQVEGDKPPRKDTPDELERLETCKENIMRELSSVLDEFASSRLILQLGGLSLDEEDSIYFRLQLRSSATRYFPKLGLLSSSYQSTNFVEPTKDDFSNHMNAVRTPTPYISISDSAGEILKLCRYQRKDDGTCNWMIWRQYMVIAISKNRISIFGVTVKRSSELKKYFGFSKFAVRYAIDSQSLAGNWIPEEALMGVFPLEQFMDVAGEHEELEISTGKSGKFETPVKWM